ncbi:zinc finger protein 37-like [Cylas formicarius]|uniref:zinc finger protein 37-like n=1 Tax=Cylas formicarius TaxID=197179 RepID=UPI0029584DE6|nr:zinc finger protein 37-like [Cylas formicarius]XP_060535185.1 zinc finger protein 37-like [Cylas formicarius]
MNNTTGSVCLICNGSCASIRNTIQIFNKDHLLPEEVNLPEVLANLLDKEIKQDGVHSQIICKKCFKLIDEYDELQSRVSEIKREISSSYANTIEKREKESGDDSKDFIDMEVRPKLVKQNVLPKKILGIPSSDEESMQDKPQGGDIQMSLVKLQNINSDFAMDTDSQSFHMFGDNSDEDLGQAASEQNKHIIKNIKVVNVKAEPGLTDESGGSETKPDNKPNILKKKVSSVSSQNFVQTIIVEQTDDKQKIEEFGSIPVVARDGNMYTCLLCSGDETVAGEAKAIISHVRREHDTRLYICDVCGQDFSKRNLLSAHLDEHVENEEGDFQCEVCNRIFNNLRLFRIHRRMHYPQNKAWTCETCGKRYSSKNLLEEHVNTHLGLRPYICQVCGKDFSSKYTFKAHEKTHEMRPRPFKCSQCPKSFLSQQNLQQHERTHSGVKEFTCHLCSKQFGSAHNLEVHSIVHTGYKPYVCGLCGKAFARKAEIRDHERTHTGERPYQCEFCGATFSQRSNLQSHKRATHYDDKRFRCEECGKGFKRRRLLDYHMKAAHTGERPFKCDICGATFVYPEHFKKHRRIHTGEKPFLCEVCGKAFNSRDNRNAHRFVHSDKKPYECLVCAAGFMRKPLLYQHMQAQGHLNDTIVVNQPRLTTDDGQLISVEEIVDTANVESKFVIEGGAEHIIIDGRQISFADASEDGENEDEMLDEIQQVVNDADGEFAEIITSESLAGTETELIDTPEGPIQLVKVRIPNENGEEEEAWIKIVPE